MEQVGFQLYRTRIGICLSYQQEAGIQGTKLPAIAMVKKAVKICVKIYLKVSSKHKHTEDACKKLLNYH